jgi:hypothetical protein
MLILTLSLENDGDDQAIDTQDTRHNNWYDRFEDQLWLEHTHACNTDSTLSGSVGSSEVCIRRMKLMMQWEVGNPYWQKLERMQYRCIRRRHLGYQQQCLYEEKRLRHGFKTKMVCVTCSKKDSENHLENL